MKFFDRALLYLLVGATMSIAISVQNGTPPSAEMDVKTASATVAIVAVFWPVMLVVGYAAALAEKDKPDAEKKAAEPTP
jgi:hypothetical protein